MCERKLRVPRRRCARPAASLTSVFTHTLSSSSFFSADGQPFLRSLGLRSSGLTVFAASCLRIMLLSSACSPMLLRTVPCNPVYAATGVHCSLFSHAAPKSRTVVMRALSPCNVSIDWFWCGVFMVEHIVGRWFFGVCTCGRGLRVKLHSVCGRCRYSSCVSVPAHYQILMDAHGLAMAFDLWALVFHMLRAHAWQVA